MILILSVLVVARGLHEVTYSFVPSVICPVLSEDFSFQKHVAITPDYLNLRHSLFVILVVVHFNLFFLRFS